MVIEGVHVRQGVPVWHCDCIEAAVVTAGVPGAVLFGHQMQERHPRRVGVANNTCFLECKELLFGDMLLLWVQPPRAGENRSYTTCVNVVFDAVEGLGVAVLGRNNVGNSLSSCCTRFRFQLLKSYGSGSGSSSISRP